MKLVNLAQKFSTNIAEAISNSMNLVPLESITSDYAKSHSNPHILGGVRLPFYATDEQGNYTGVVNEAKGDKDWLIGYMTSGFGWSIGNEYEDLLGVSSDQKNLTRFLQGAGTLSSMLPKGLLPEEAQGFLDSNAGKTVMSLQQTMSVWMGMKKQNFDLSLLFFDAEGSRSTSVSQVAYIIERAMLPYVNPLGDTGWNLVMSAPGGYHPTLRNDNNDGVVNRKYSLSAKGTGEVYIGSFIHFPEVICNNASMRFSDIMLNNGQPQWLEVTFSFHLWRQQTLEDLKSRYSIPSDNNDSAFTSSTLRGLYEGLNR